jgi:hypothetical protein
MRTLDPRKLLPGGLTGVAGLACAACCAVPLLLAAGVLSGAGWAAAGRILPGIAVATTAAAAGAWWWAGRRRRHRRGCAAGGGCDCGERATEPRQETISVRSQP